MMKVQCRLARLLQEHDLDYRGVVGDIAAATKVTRQTVARLLRGDGTSLSLPMLGDLSQWLIDKGVPAETLPQNLIGPDAIWDHVRAAKRIAICLGEYEPEDPRRLARSMVARRDAEVATSLIRKLAHYRILMAKELFIHYVPFQYANPTGTSVRLKDRTNAHRLFEEMRLWQDSKQEPTVVFLVGSQKCNLLVEEMVASHFRCHPYVPASARRAVPLYLSYRQGDPPLDSCFGGTGHPSGAAGKREPGIYYRSGDDWVCCPYKDGASDAGVVIVAQHPLSRSLEIGIFGFSSVGTSAVGKYFLDHSDEFWPPNAELNGRHVGAYVCRFRYVEEGQDPECRVFTLSKKDLQVVGRSERRAPKTRQRSRR
jgi:hypothetical protein